MFASLGGDEKPIPRRNKVTDPSDEFHLGDISEFEELTPTMDANQVDHILGQFMVVPELVQTLEGEAKQAATNQLFRLNALREARLAHWIKDQCGPLQREYVSCFAKTRFKIPGISCSAEQDLHANCMNLATVRFLPPASSVLSISYAHTPSSLQSLTCPSYYRTLLLKEREYSNRNRLPFSKTCLPQSRGLTRTPLCKAMVHVMESLLFISLLCRRCRICTL